MKSVHVLARIDRVKDTLRPVFADAGRQRRLHQNAVTRRIGVERPHLIQHLIDGGVSRKAVHAHSQPRFRAGALLVADVDM